MYTKKLVLSGLLAPVFCFSLVVCSEMSGNGQNQAQVVQKNDAIMQDARIVLAAGASSYGDSPVTGKVCLIASNKDLTKIEKGDIVVAPAINSKWYSSLANAGGIITEKSSSGGSDLLAFGRKMGIPVIIGAKDITKKVVDGQIITLDPVSNNIYHVAHSEGDGLKFESLKLEQKNNDNKDLHEKLVGQQGANIPLAGDEKKENAPQKDKNLKNKPAVQHINAPVLMISKMRVLTDKNVIEKYIVNTQAKMDKGRFWGKSFAKGFGISSKAFDAMPVEKFTDSYKRNHKVDPKSAMNRIAHEEAILYINQATEEFIRRYNPKKMSYAVESDLAEFLHDKLVDHLELTDKDKVKAKGDPLLLQTFLEEGKVDKDQYEDLTCWNLATDYYVHKKVEE